MSLDHALTFDAPDLGAALTALSDGDLDALSFGVVEMSPDGQVLRYNATEARYSGLSPERVLGRHFFREVAPCCNNRHVAERYAAPALDETAAYTFALRMKPVPVTLRMIKPAGAGRMHLVVRWA